MSYETAPVTQMVATHCCICGRALCDADSIEIGIGPVCRAKYVSNEAPDQPLPAAELLDMSLKAGIECSTLEQKILAGDMRVVVNYLLYQASAAISDASLVIEIARVIEACGYGVVARKLYADRMPVMNLAGNLIQVISDYKESLPGALKKIGGRWNANMKVWEVPASQQEACQNTLHAVYQTRYVLVGMNVEARDPLVAAANLKPVATSTKPAPVYRVECVGSIVKCYTPYNAGFIQAIKRTPKARWDGKAWSAAIFATQAVQMIKDYYGNVKVEVV